ncbi:adenylate/guanylate cyclase domain-containing protein [Paenarthrobacter sp. NPDC089675]|uniref:adenylate/guanylate cyclase domain-containing protein n=1 Tax=Paenarthrobacter sp. NPDC089675 TaxID=3364376 RepID=UPI00380CACA8
MSIKDLMESNVNSMMVNSWNVRDGRDVPDTEALGLGTNVGVQLQATYLYADLAKSSDFGQLLDPVDAAKIIKSFLFCASALIKEHGGHIKSFDGDRVMAIYHGTEKENRAARTALKLNWVVQEIIDDKAGRWVDWPEGAMTVKHATGIATGEALLIRGGVRNDNDIASIGSAPNLAAKLSDLRTDDGRTFACYRTWLGITGDMARNFYDRDRWSELKHITVGNKLQIYKATNERMIP